VTLSFVISRLPGMLLLCALCACAALPGERDPRDPWERYNRAIYKFNDTADKAVLKPVAKAYKVVTPRFVRSGVTNFFSNLAEVPVIANDVLQAKFKQAVSDAGRFIINSTFGLFGLIDLGSTIGIPKHNEDFGQTLGYWGIGPGYYWMLPIFGPSTVRDVGGRVVDGYLFSPYAYVKDVPARNSAYAVDVVNYRANLLDTEKIFEEAALDPYVFLRDAYYQRRERLVNDGKAPEKKLDEDLDDPETHERDTRPNYQPKLKF
jgi:phospholipid-binding lipoprotein MlaA